ncbi:hypothetical protein ACVGWW_07940, partial [Enterobacter hormaechei]
LNPFRKKSDWFTWYSLRPGKPVVFIFALVLFVPFNPGLCRVANKRVFAGIFTLFNSCNV